MRVLLVSHARNDPDAGASRVYHLLEKGLTERGHYVKTLHYEDFNIPLFAERVLSRLFLAQAVSRRAEKENLADYDVIMSSSGMLYPLYRKLKSRSDSPLLVNQLPGSAYFDHVVRITESMRGHMALSWIYRKITGNLPVENDAKGSKYADLTIVHNGRDQDLFEDLDLSPVEKISLALHPEILQAGASAPAPETRDPHALLWFGSWVERKGQYYLARAFRAIVEGDPLATLTIGGTNYPPERVLQDFDEDLRSRITVLPHITRAEQIQLFSRSSIFLFPSLSEGFGFALLEAMAMGLAAITTHTGVAVDLPSGFESVRLIPAASSLHIAKAALELIHQDGRRICIAKHAHTVATHFTAERLAETHEAVFERYLASKAAQPASAR